MQPADISKDNLTFGPLAMKVAIPALIVGVVALAVSVVLGMSQSGGLSRFYHAYLVAYAFSLSLGLGALFFVMLQHLTNAGWSVTVRRLAEGISMTLPLMLVLFIPIVVGMHELYPWTHVGDASHGHLLEHKQPYLNTTFFLIRWAVYLVVWSGLAWYFRRKSISQDTDGDANTTLRLSRRSAPAMILFAITITFAAFDLLMSRDPAWFSTIYGVYYFSGAVVGFFALLTWGIVGLQKVGRIQDAVTIEHYHDLGKLMFSFVVFWAYIAFSQYMLIWYANIPEETGWFLRRQTDDWSAVSLLLLFGHFIVPFLALISRHPKRRKKLLALGALWVLFMHAVDMYWLVMPEAGFAGIGFSIQHLTCLVGIGALFFAVINLSLRKCALIPIKDPRLDEALAFENV